MLLLERNEKLGKKLYLTGKGRCNVTNACETQELFGQILRNAKFMYSAIYTFDNFRVMDFFEQNKIPLKTERGGRVFPVSDHSSDIIRALSETLRRLQVSVRLHTRVCSVVKENGCFLITDSTGRTYPAEKVILATGAFLSGHWFGRGRVLVCAAIRPYDHSADAELVCNGCKRSLYQKSPGAFS